MTDITADPITPAPDQDPNAAKLHADRDRLIAILATHNVAVRRHQVRWLRRRRPDWGHRLLRGRWRNIIGTLEAPEPLASRAGAPIPVPEVALRTDLEQFAYDALFDLHRGWEDNDGGFGEVTLDVVDKTATLDFNMRYHRNPQYLFRAVRRAMAHPYHHALSSVKKWGGSVDDYLPLHAWFDQSKEILADFRHRALRHHAEGIFMLETLFGSHPHPLDGPHHPDAMDRRTACDRGSRPHPELRRLGARHPARTVDGPRRQTPHRHRGRARCRRIRFIPRLTKARPRAGLSSFSTPNLINKEKNHG